MSRTDPCHRTAGLAGDVITALTGKPFYITSSRFRSMVTDYVTPMDETYTVLGQPKFCPRLHLTLSTSAGRTPALQLQPSPD